MLRYAFTILMLSAVLAFGIAAKAERLDFDQWLENFKATARTQGVAAEVIEDAFAGIVEDDEVVRLDGKQPEGKINLTKYLKNTVTPRRIRIGRDMLAEHREVLAKIAKEYDVEPAYIVALWGIETDFGNYTGNFSVIQSLATLAYEGRRSEFFGKELMTALRILEAEKMKSAEMQGSWAGAMGNCQFMPSTYWSYAVDGDGDGHRDIWNSKADSFASIANYLHALGWKRKLGWGGAAKTPKHYKVSSQGLKRGKTATGWHKYGVSFHNKAKTPHDAAAILYAIHPGSTEQGVFLVTENYKALLQWNRSRYFATAVGSLADAIGE